MNPIPADTTIEAAKKQFEILRRLDAETRLKMAFELSDNLRSIVEAGVRLRHPEYDEQQINRQVIRLIIGEALFKQIYPDAERQI
jgi:hypothetical protein